MSPRDPENELYIFEKDLKARLRPVIRVSRNEAVNPARRQKPKRRREGDTPYKKTRRDRRRRAPNPPRKIP